MHLALQQELVSVWISDVDCNFYTNTNMNIQYGKCAHAPLLHPQLPSPFFLLDQH